MDGAPVVDRTGRKTKIICTLGPESGSEATLRDLIRAGMNVARLNFSHGSLASHAEHIQRVRAVASEMNVPIAILQDLQGPRIRIGRFENGGSIKLEAGRQFTLTTAKIPGTSERVTTTFAGLPASVTAGDSLLIDDGRLELEVESVSGPDVVTRVVRGGRLRSNKGINLPGIVVDIPVLTEKDRRDLAFGLRQRVDFVAVSFVQRAADIVHVRNVMRELNPARGETAIIAKLEKPAAIDNLEEILDVVEGVMVARGDLGVEMSPQKVPSAQKYIIERTNERGKIVITATQMLESMIASPRPTRAESSDVANAIFDGTDAVMLSAETAAGKFPIESVQFMADIAIEAERHEHEWGRFKELDDPTSEDSVALARAARDLANNLSVAAIAIFTVTGSTARLVSKERPRVPILAFTPVAETYPRMALLWGVTPHLIQRAASVEEMIRYVEESLRKHEQVEEGSQLVLIAGLPIAKMGPPNIVLLHTFGAEV